MTQPWDQSDGQHWQRPAAGSDLPEPTLEMPTEQLRPDDGWGSGASAAELPTFSPYEDQPAQQRFDRAQPAQQRFDQAQSHQQPQPHQPAGPQAHDAQQYGRPVPPQYPPQDHPGPSPYGAQQYAGQPYPGGQYAAQCPEQQYHPAQPYPAQQYPGQQYPGQQYPGQGVTQPGYPVAHPVVVNAIGGWPTLPSLQAPYGYEPATGLPYSDKCKVTAGLLQLLLGVFGAGRFYKGDIGIAIAQVVVVLLTLGFGAIWPFVDGIVMLCGRPTDRYGRPLHD